MKEIKWTVASRSNVSNLIILLVNVDAGLPSRGDLVVCVETGRRYKVISLAVGLGHEAAKEGIHGLSVEAIDGRPEDDLTTGMHFVQASED
ncbi:hypothetical protein WME73_41285 [Sorangium sp. So ce302]|uniref:hypothetical protein n=1 Tax=unclassified Sorangium TaxID=2621164 RepID=UPI003F5EFA40